MKVSASPVFEEIVERRRIKGRLDKAIPILGVPSDAVLAFVGFLCSPRSVLSLSLFILLC